MNIHLLSAIEIRDKFLSGELLSVEIVQHYLNRIKKYDPQIGAFLSIFTDKALQKAAILDKKRQEGQKLGKLASLPIAIKDNIHIKNEITTCASKFLTNYLASFDADVIEYIEAEDGIIIGKCNMDEFAMGSSTENSAFQKTYNPWNLKTSPGGSSGGSAAAIAARLCPLALGSDTGGSVRQPASLCGIVGFKPTYGRVSRSGLVAYGSSLDQIGPLSTKIADSALLMEVIGRHSPKDSTSIPERPQEYLRKFSENLSGIKIGIPWKFLEGLDHEIHEIFNKNLEILQGLGAEIVSIDLSILKHSLAVYYILATAEASTNLARFDGIRYGHRSSKAKTLEEIYDLSKEEGFGPEVKRRIMLGTFVLSSGHQEAYYRKGQKVRTLIIEQFKKEFEKCDIIAMPTSPFAAFEIGSIHDPIQMYLADTYTTSINLAGIPSVSVPAGFTKERKPIGLQLIGPQKQDVHVLNTAYAFEQATSFHSEIPELIKE